MNIIKWVFFTALCYISTVLVLPEINARSAEEIAFVQLFPVVCVAYLVLLIAYKLGIWQKSKYLAEVTAKKWTHQDYVKDSYSYFRAELSCQETDVISLPSDELVEGWFTEGVVLALSDKAIFFAGRLSIDKNSCAAYLAEESGNVEYLFITEDLATAQHKIKKIVNTLK